MVELGEKKFVGMKFAGPFEALPVEIPKLWADFLSRVEAAPAYYGVSDEDFTYKLYTEYIAVEVEQFDSIPYGMVGFTVPPRRYVQVTHRGPMSKVQDTYLQLFRWMKEQGYEQDISTFRLEKYDQRFLPTVDDSAREENAYDILIPIK